MTKYEIQKNSGGVIFSLECESLKFCLEAAVHVDANLSGASLIDANLIDAGADTRGYRFWAWRSDAGVVYRAGCREWTDYETAKSHYGAGYCSNGNRAECLARLAILHLIGAGD